MLQLVFRLLTAQALLPLLPALLMGAPGEQAAPLRVLSSGPGAGHYLERGGKPLFLIGDSITHGWAESGRDFDQEAYVRALARRGIRALHLWAFIAPQAGDDERIGYDAPEILPWVKVEDSEAQEASVGEHEAERPEVGQPEGGRPARGTPRWDLGRHDDAYFARLRRLSELARDASILVVIQVFDGWPKTRFAAHPFNVLNGGPLEDRWQFVELADYEREMPDAPEPGWAWRERNQHAQERFALRLIEATSDLPNVLYELFNEGEWYDPDLRRRHEAHFLSLFRARCRNLLVSNDDHIAGPDFRGDARCDVISHHRPNWSCATAATTSFGHYLREFRGAPSKPFLFTEPVPEFGGAEDCEVEAMTRLMWGTALGGAGFFVQNDASFGFNPKARIAARAELRDRMLDREGACSRFFNALGVGWAAMEPAPEVTSTGVAMARRGAEYVIYSQDGPSFTVDLSASGGSSQERPPSTGALPDRTSFEGRFYDPRTGELTEAVEIAGGSGDVRIAKPDSRDWVWWLRRSEDAAGKTWAERLGYPEGKVVLLLHSDDVGMCYEANHAAKEYLASARVRSGSLMAPCPWFDEMAAWYREHPDVDLGLHLTLTSEWKHYRWGPVARAADVPRLVDPDGYLWRSAVAVATKAGAAEVEREIRAQLEKALSRGIRPGHLDTHMGTLFARADYTAAYLRLAEEHGIPALVLEFRPDVLERFRREGYPITDEMVRLTEGYSLPKLDDLRSVPGGTTYEEKRDAFFSLVRSLRPGITEIILHPSIESEALRRITGSWQQRVWEARLFSDPDVDSFFRKEGVIFTDWKEMMRRHAEARG